VRGGREFFELLVAVCAAAMETRWWWVLGGDVSVDGTDSVQVYYGDGSSNGTVYASEHYLLNAY
jgi:hypothetical protein